MQGEAGRMKLADGAGLIATSARSARPVPVFRPGSCAEALGLLAGGARPTLVAGGTDLCAQFNEGLQPDTLLALDRIAELQAVDLARGVLRIGSGVTHAAGSSHPLVRQHLPGFAEAWARIANIRVRHWATIGGNLMARRPRYEMSLLLTALDARLHFLGPDGAERVTTPAELPSVPSGALLHHVAVPLSGATFFRYDRSLRPIMTLALCRDAAGCRAVIATEMLHPVLLPVAQGLPPAQAAEATLAVLPSDFADAVTSNWYLRRSGTVLLRRGLEAMAGHV